MSSVKGHLCHFTKLFGCFSCFLGPGPVALGWFAPVAALAPSAAYPLVALLSSSLQQGLCQAGRRPELPVCINSRFQEAQMKSTKCGNFLSYFGWEISH